MPESSAAVKHRAKNFYGRTPPSLPTCKTELDILIERHQFIRDSNEQNLSWEDALAKKTYDQLFKELAVCDLSRWKEGKVAMRWRTASEVIDGKGHFTCANLRCKHHEILPQEPIPKVGMNKPRHQGRRSRPIGGEFETQDSYISLSEFGEEEQDQTQEDRSDSKVKLTLQELQTSFGYVEQGVRKLAEVKLKLCRRCARKMNSCSQSKRKTENPTKSITQSSSSQQKRRLTGSPTSPATDKDPCGDRPSKFPRTSNR